MHKCEWSEGHCLWLCAGFDRRSDARGPARAIGGRWLTKVLRENASGASSERRELATMLKVIGPGDEVTVTRIDRLARSTFDLFSIVKAIVDAGARFRSIA